MFKNKKTFYIFLAFSAMLFSSLAFAQTARQEQTFFEVLTSNMFDTVIETFDMKPGRLNNFQIWLMGMCFIWEFGHIYMALAVGENVLQRSIQFVFRTILCFCLMGITPYREITGGLFDGVGGKYEGQYLDIDLYNFVNKKAKEAIRGLDKSTTIKDTDSFIEGQSTLREYCEGKADQSECFKMGMKKLSPNKDGQVDAKFVSDMKSYINTSNGCVTDDGILSKNLVNPDSKEVVSEGAPSIFGISTSSIPGLGPLVSSVKCIKSKINGISSSASNPGKQLAYWISSILNVIMNLLISVLINIVLMANLIELLFMLIFSRYIYPFLMIEKQKDKVYTFIKAFVAFGLIPILMKIGFWVTDGLLEVVLGTFLNDPVGFVFKFFASPATGNTGATGAVAGVAGATALAVGAPYLMSIALMIIQGVLIAIAALKIAILIKLTKMAMQLFELNFSAIYGIGKEAMGMVASIGTMVGAAVLTGGAALSVVGGKGMSAAASKMSSLKSPIGAPAPSNINDGDGDRNKDVEVRNTVKTENKTPDTNSFSARKGVKEKELSESESEIEKRHSKKRYWNIQDVMDGKVDFTSSEKKEGDSEKKHAGNESIPHIPFPYNKTSNMKNNHASDIIPTVNEDWKDVLFKSAELGLLSKSGGKRSPDKGDDEQTRMVFTEFQLPKKPSKDNVNIGLSGTSSVLPISNKNNSINSDINKPTKENETLGGTSENWNQIAKIIASEVASAMKDAIKESGLVGANGGANGGANKTEKAMQLEEEALIEAKRLKNRTPDQIINDDLKEEEKQKYIEKEKKRARFLKGPDEENEELSNLMINDKYNKDKDEDLGFYEKLFKEIKEKRELNELNENPEKVKTKAMVNHLISTVMNPMDAQAGLGLISSTSNVMNDASIKLKSDQLAYIEKKITNNGERKGVEDVDSYLSFRRSQSLISEIIGLEEKTVEKLLKNKHSKFQEEIAKMNKYNIERLKKREEDDQL